MKTKIFTLILVILFVLGACGTTSQNEENNEATDPSNGSGAEETKEQVRTEDMELPQLSVEVGENERLVEMETSMGIIKIKLFPEYAPKTVENFITHSENGYYEGVVFHRVIEDFMIQGGDPDGTGRGGESIYGTPFEDEFSPNLYNIRGALSMANAGPNTNGSQFFIVQNQSKLDESMRQQMAKAKYPTRIIEAYDNGGTPWLDYGHTVFGQVIEGMEVVDKIASTPKDANDKPLEDVVIKKITVLK